MDLNMKIGVDTEELDRLVVGARCYDALRLKWCKGYMNDHSILVLHEGKIMISKQALLDLIRLVNYSNIDETEVDIVDLSPRDLQRMKEQTRKSGPPSTGSPVQRPRDLSSTINWTNN